MSAKEIAKKTAKVGARGALQLVNISAVAAKYGLSIVDSVVGGYAHGLANSMAGGIGKTPLKDMAFKATNKIFDGISKFSKKLDEKVKNW